MIRMFVRHQVTDYAKWRAAYDSFKPEHPAMGVRAEAVYQTAGEPNDVTVTHDFDNLEAAKGFVAMPRLKDAMQEAGVSGEPTIWFTEPA